MTFNLTTSEVTNLIHKAIKAGKDSVTSPKQTDEFLLELALTELACEYKKKLTGRLTKFKKVAAGNDIPHEVQQLENDIYYLKNEFGV